MILKFVPGFLCAVVLIGCSQPPVTPEAPLEYADPIVPTAPVVSTDTIREPSVLERSYSRGGAAIRLAEDADVLANSHYVAPSEPLNTTNASSEDSTKNSSQTKKITKDRSIYPSKSKVDHSIYPLKTKDRSVYVKQGKAD